MAQNEKVINVPKKVAIRRWDSANVTGKLSSRGKPSRHIAIVAYVETDTVTQPFS